MNAIVKHTPGPWALRSATASMPTTHVYGPSGHIASVTGKPHEANAHLIAAAPDLLAALKALVPEIEEEIVQRQTSGNDEEWRNLSDLSDAAVLAIAKAEGRL